MKKNTMIITGIIAAIAVITAVTIYANQSKEKYSAKPLGENPKTKPPVKLNA